MAKIKTVTRPYKNKDGEKKIYVRISHKGETRYISTEETILPKYWSTSGGRVKKTLTGWISINERIEALEELFRNRLNQLLLGAIAFSVDDIIDIPTAETPEDFFFPFAENYIQKYKRNRRNTSFKRHNTVLNKLKEFSNSSLRFSDIDVTFLTKFENYLAGLGNKTNTIYSNLKIVRSIYYQAIREGLASQEKNPFFIFKLKTEPVYKEKLTESELSLFAKHQFARNSFKWHTQNYFLAAYYMAGIRFGDLCLLKVKNIQNGRLNYVMSKTGRSMSLPINAHLSRIFEYYGVKEKEDEDFIFPLLNQETDYSDIDTLSNDISSRNSQVNSTLKTIATEVGISKKIHFHQSRHSFADISRKKGVSIYDISKLLGHSSIKITENYLASIDPETYDEALSVIYN